jgi:hypothetical protein
MKGLVLGLAVGLAVLVLQTQEAKAAEACQIEAPWTSYNSAHEAMPAINECKAGNFIRLRTGAPSQLSTLICNYDKQIVVARHDNGFFYMSCVRNDQKITWERWVASYRER